MHTPSKPWTDTGSCRPMTAAVSTSCKDRSIRAASGAWRRPRGTSGSHVRSRTFARFGDLGKIRVGVKTTADSIFIRDDWHALAGTCDRKCCAPSRLTSSRAAIVRSTGCKADPLHARIPRRATRRYRSRSIPAHLRVSGKLPRTAGTATLRDRRRQAVVRDLGPAGSSSVVASEARLPGYLCRARVLGR